MHMRRTAFILAFLIGLTSIPAITAAEQPITRRDAYIQIWKSVNRPAQETKEKPFTDVPPGSEGFLEITFGKKRGMIDTTESLRATDPLDLETALLWLFRTKNVIEHARITVENFPLLLGRYPVLDGLSGVKDGAYAERLVTPSELSGLIARLKKLMDEEVHLVTYYADAFHGKGTAYGETFDMYALTAAHRSFPYNTLLRVTNVKNGKSVVVRVNDTGPWVKPGHKYYDKLDLDLSMAAFRIISDTGRGVEEATIERLGDVSLADSGTQEQVVAQESAEARFCRTGETRTAQRLFRGATLTRGVPQWLKTGAELVLASASHFQVVEIRLPDGRREPIGVNVEPGVDFRRVLADPGTYRLVVATPEGRRRIYGLRLTDCR